MDPELVAGLARPSDTIVQFNGCRHAAALAHIEARRRFVFNVPHDAMPHGFGTVDLPDDTAQTDIWFASDQHDNPHILDLVRQDIGIHKNLNDSLGPFDLRKLGFYPSIGFQVAMTEALGGGKVALVGFTSEAGWLGHNFELERLLLRNTTLISFETHARDADLSPGAAFRSTFSPDYDFASKNMKSVLADVGSALWRSGEKPTAVRFLKELSALQPGRDYPLRELATLAKIDPSIYEVPQDVIEAYWANAAGLPNTSQNYQHCSPFFGFSPERTSERKRVLLFNHTSAMRFNRWHIGCAVVMEQLLHLLDTHNMDCAGWLNQASDLTRILELDPNLDGVDAILINGEGSFHDDAKRPVELALAAVFLKTKFDKPVYFINGAWQDNGPLLRSVMQDMDLISVRDQRSLDQLAMDHAQVLPDLTWTLDPTSEAPNAARNGTAVIDSVNEDQTETLMRDAVERSCDFWIMGEYWKTSHKLLTRRRTLPKVARDHHAFANYDVVITGRYHGACLALQSGCSVYFTPSNTFKLQAMFDDIGLTDKDYIPDKKLPLYDAREQDLILTYKQTARDGYAQLFKTIQTRLNSP